MLPVVMPLQKQQPKSIFKNPERNNKNEKENKIKKVRFSEDCEIKYTNKHLFLFVFLTILLITSVVLYFSLKDKLNHQECRVYIRQILDYISLVAIKIKMLIYNPAPSLSL